MENLNNTNKHTREPMDWKKYAIAFLITCIIFAGAVYLNTKLSQSRTVDIKAVQDRISLDLLSSETQYDLLKESSCKSVNDTSVLSQELNSLATKLSYLESNTKSADNDAELIYIKKYYSLLEIKDFLLMNQISQKCKSKPIAMLYFYSTKTDCADCEKMGYVLTYLREQYPELRIYSFDYNLGLSAIDTLKSVYKIDANLPAVVIGDQTIRGFHDVDAMKNLIPALKKIDKQRLIDAQKNKTGSSTNSTSTGTKNASTTPSQNVNNSSATTSSSTTE